MNILLIGFTSRNSTAGSFSVDIHPESFHRSFAFAEGHWIGPPLHPALFAEFDKFLRRLFRALNAIWLTACLQVSTGVHRVAKKLEPGAFATQDSGYSIC